MSQQIELGDLAKDRVTGFTGVVMSRTEWFNRCVRVQLQPRGLKEDGSVPCSESFDVEQLDIVTKNEVSPKPIERSSGGPMPTVTRAPDPTR